MGLDAVNFAAAQILSGSRTGGRGRVESMSRVGIGASGGAWAVVTKKMLKRAGMTLAEIDLFELNEAFASVVLRYMQAFELDPAKMNVNGGAIAMGHPLGATGAMILGTVLDELERRNLSTALVTLCIGAGMGTATVIERV